MARILFATILVIPLIVIVGCSGKVDSEGYYWVEPVDDPFALPYKFAIKKKRVGMGSAGNPVLEQYVPVDIYGGDITGMYLIGNNWWPADTRTAMLFYADTEGKKIISQINVNTTGISSHYPYDFDCDNVTEVAVTYTMRDTLWLHIIDPHQRSIYRRPLVAGQDRDGNGFWDGSGIFCGVHDFNGDGFVELLVNCDVGYDLYPRKLMCVDWINDEAVWEYPVAGIINSAHTYVESLAPGNERAVVFGVSSKGNAAKAADMDDQHSYVIVLDEKGKLRWKRETGGVFSSCSPVLIDYDGDSTTDVLTTCRYEASKSTDDTLGEHGGMFKIYDMQGELLDSIDLGVGRVISGVRLLDFDSDGTVEVFVSLTDGSIAIYDQRLAPIRKAKFYTTALVWDCHDFLSSRENQLLIGTADNKLWLLNKEFRPLAQFGEGEALHCGKSSVFKTGKAPKRYELIVAGNAGQVTYFLTLVKTPWNAVFSRDPLLVFLAAFLPMSLVVVLIWFNWYRARKQNKIISQQRDRLNTVLESLKATQEKLIAVEEYRRTEEALQEKEERYTLATSAAKVGVWDWDLRNGSFYLDPNIKALLGYEDSEIPNDIEVWTQYIHPDDKDAVMQAASDHLEGRTPAYVFEHRMLHKDGTIRWFMVRGTAIRDADGNVIRMVGTDTDITDRKRAEQALRESEEEYRDLTEKMVDVIYTLDTEGTVTSVNEAIKAMLGFEPEEVIGKSFTELVLQEEIPEAMAAFQRILNGEQVTTETILIDRNGEPHNVEFSSSPIIKGNQAVGTRGIVRDITERKRVDAREKARLQLLNNLRTARNIDACLEYGCKAIYEAGLFRRAVLTLHSDKKEIINLGQVGLDENVVQAARNAPAPDDELSKKMTQEKYRISHSYFIPEETGLGLTETPRHISQPDYTERGDSSWKQGDELFVPIIGDDNKYEGWLSVDTPFNGERPTIEIVRFLEQVVDTVTQKVREIITLEKLRQGHKALRESEERYRALFEGSAEGVLVADIETRQFKYANPAICAMLGYNEEELKRMSVVDIHPQDALERVISEFEAQARGEKTLAPGIPCLRKDGTTIYADIVTTKVLIDGRECNVGFFSDITERKQAEERLRLFSQAVNSSVDGIAMGSLEGRITYVNEGFTGMFGYSREELIGKEIASLYAEDQIPKLEKAIKATIEGGWSGELIGKRRNGRLFPIAVSASRVVDDKGKVIALMASHQDITERKRAEEALRESEERNRTLVANIPGAVYRAACDPEKWTISFFSDPIEEICGYPASDFINDRVRTYASIIHPEDAKMVGEVVLDCVGKKETYDVEYRVLHADGYPRWIHDKGQGVFDEKGELLWLDGVVLHITERKKAEEALKESEEKFRTLAEQSPNMIYINKKGKTVWANRRCEEIMGYSREEFCSPDFDFLSLIAPDRRHMVKEMFGKHMKGQEVPPYEYALVNKQGKRIEAINTTRLIMYGGEEALLGIITDITERKRAEQALLESEERFRNVSASAQDAILMMDNEGRVSFWNEAAERVFGYQAEEILGKSLHETLGAERFHDAYRKGFGPFRETGEGVVVGQTLELAAVRKDGTEFPIELSVSAIKLKGKWNAVGILRDITERKQAEQALRSERDFVRSLLDTANSLVVCLDNQARITVFNRECEKVTGYTREEVIGKSWPEVFLPEEARHDGLENFAEWVRQHPRDMYEGSLKTKSGQIRTILWSNSALFFPDSDEITAIAVGQDITERKEAERQLQVASQKRYNQVKEIAGGVSHEIFNALFPATSCLGKLSQRLDLNEAEEVVRNRKLIQVAEDAVERAIEMTELVTEYSKLESDRKVEEVSLQAILQEILLANECRIEELKVQVRLEISGDFLLKCKCHRPHGYSLFNNLMVNALDALAEVTKRSISISAYRERDRLRIEFSDSGAGIPPENIDKIFDAFFSTKPRTGTGLGLAISKKIVELYDGSIEVNSLLDKGTKFIILLPSF